MAKPTLPRKVSATIDKITAQTWAQLIDCVAWGMEHPRGDGDTILNTDNSILRVRRQPAAGVASGGGAVTLGVITSRPSGGYGTATYKAITLNADGSWSATGPDIACVIPKF